MAVADTPTNLTRGAHAGIPVSDLDVSIAFHAALTGRGPVAQGAMGSVPSGFLGDDCTFIAGEVTPDAALGTKVACFNDPGGHEPGDHRAEGRVRRPGHAFPPGPGGRSGAPRPGHAWGVSGPCGSVRLPGRGGPGGRGR